MPSVIKVIVAGKKIEDVLLALQPYALEPPVVEVLTARADSPAKIIKMVPTNVAVLNFIDAMSKQGEKTITTKQLKEECIAHGASHYAYGYALKKAIGLKKLKRTNHPSTYEIVK